MLYVDSISSGCPDSTGARVDLEDASGCREADTIFCVVACRGALEGDLDQRSGTEFRQIR